MGKLVDKINYHIAESGVDKKYKIIKCCGVCTSICNDILNDAGDIVDVRIHDTYLIINSTEIVNNVFIFVVAVICHEMIHAYDR